MTTSTRSTESLFGILPIPEVMTNAQSLESAGLVDNKAIMQPLDLMLETGRPRRIDYRAPRSRTYPTAASDEWLNPR